MVVGAKEGVSRFVVTGSAGQLGTDLMKVLDRSRHDLVALSRDQLDVTDRSAVHATISDLAPDVVLHAAAMTSVDSCETEPDAAFAANALAPRWVVEACRDANAKMVLFSTDYMFSGELDRPYHEWDLTGPRSIYGLSKLAGEQETHSEDLVVRTSWLCGANGSNMVKTVLRLASQNTEMAFVDDQIGNPSFTIDVANMTLELIEAKATGVVHVTNQGATSWFGFVREILATAGHSIDLVRAISTDELTPPRPAPRPANSVLDNCVVRLLGLPENRSWTEALAEVVEELR